MIGNKSIFYRHLQGLTIQKTCIKSDIINLELMGRGSIFIFTYYFKPNFPTQAFHLNERMITQHLGTLKSKDVENHRSG